MSLRPRREVKSGMNWDEVADWYLGWVGEFGSKHHRLLAIPEVMSLLDLRRGESVLDIGSGHGVLAQHVLAAGATYTGIDVSARLIEAGRRAYGRRVRFFIGDATRLTDIRDLAPGSFSAVTFLLSIQDIDPLEAALENAAKALEPGGRIVILMTHPAFRIPRHSGWGWDEGRKLRFRRVDGYLSRMAIPLRATQSRKNVSVTFHRPLEAYFAAIAAAGLLVDSFHEIPTFKTSESGPSAKADLAASREFPLFAAIRAWKLTE